MTRLNRFRKRQETLIANLIVVEVKNLHLGKALGIGKHVAESSETGVSDLVASQVHCHNILRVTRLAGRSEC
eukprot:CAMPEP_0115867278 /NCGR_PEP_ID=MMETSP0287-20121206/20686_1 /TAXON_ID=412157 /ORGANISM="Chrysochromulina rotalis, Strain UIO044" /LENGTH=71 /DNA_ID=CAMNT_0003321879 /DNA_START=297 /DNA_END=512 /DNA_ORIENTATION=+